MSNSLFPIPDHWEPTTLGEACKRGGGNIQTGPFGSQLHAADYVPIGIPSIMPQNIGDNRISEVGIARITNEDAQRLSRYLVQPGDIVYSRRGDVERRALIREREAGWLCGTGCLRVRFGDGVVHPPYAAYYLGHPIAREWIVRHAQGATMPNLNTSILSSLPFVLPSMDDQRAIAQILGTLDDKIELNRRMNETLEAMARAIFQSWFVDFDPVRAKASGESADSICQRLGLTPELLALFPDSFEDSELGEIPRGWEVGPLESMLVLQRGFDLPTSDRKPGKYPILASSGPSGTHSEHMVRGPGVTTGRSGVLGKVFYVHEDYWPLNTSLWVKEFKRAKPSYAFYLLQRLDFNGLNAGSAVPTLNRNHAHAVRVLVPPQAVIDVFEPMAEMLLTQQRRCVEQANTVAAIRDSLLPKLLSGSLPCNSLEMIDEIE